MPTQAGKEYFMNSIRGNNPSIWGTVAAEKKMKQNEGLPFFGNVTGNNFLAYPGNFIGGLGSQFFGGLGDVATFVGADTPANFLYDISDEIEERLPEAKPAEWSWDYISSPSGLARGSGNVAGSIASILLPTLAMPESAPATIGRGLAAIPRFGKLFSTANPAMTGRFFTSGIPEAAMEAGNYYRNAVSQGMNPQEAWDNRLGVFGRNAIGLPISNAVQYGLFTKLLGGRPFVSATGELLSQGLEEFEQEAFQNQALGKPYTYSPIEAAANPDKYKEQIQAAKAGVVDFLPFTALGYAGGRARNWLFPEKTENTDTRQETPPQETTTPPENPPETPSTNGNGANGIDNFMRAIGGQESGDNYDAVNYDAGEMRGKYQIDVDNWSQWAQDAGLPADAPMTPENQERVARNKMQEYYNKFGNWRDVAIAWYGGERAVGYSEEAKNKPQYSNGNEYPSINEYADSVMERFNNLGGSESNEEDEDIYVGENGKGEGTYWVRNEGASLDGAQPDLLNAIDMLGKYFYDKTGKQLVVTAGTNGDHPSNGSEHGHDAGWKVDIADAGANGVGINEDGALFTANFEAQPFLKDFIAYGRSLGLGMNLEGEGTSNVHIDVALDGTQWDGNGENAGGFNPKKGRSRKNGKGNTGATGATGATLDDEDSDIQPAKPVTFDDIIKDILRDNNNAQFNINSDDEGTLQTISDFAVSKRDTATGEAAMKLQEMFDTDGNFIQNRKNLKTLNELFGDELKEFGQGEFNERWSDLLQKSMTPNFIENLTDDDRKLFGNILKQKLKDAGIDLKGMSAVKQGLEKGDEKTFVNAWQALQDRMNKTEDAEPIISDKTQKALDDIANRVNELTLNAEENAPQIDANSKLYREINKLNGEISKLTADREKLSQTKGNQAVQVDAAGKIAKIDADIRKKQTELDAKIDSFYNPPQPAQPVKVEPSKRFAPIKAQADDAIENLNQQIETLRAQGLEDDSVELEQLNDNKFAIQAAVDELANLDSQAATAKKKQIAAEKANDAKAREMAKKQFSTALNRYKKQEQKLNELLNPPAEPTPVQEEPVELAPEFANELDAIQQRKKGLRDSGAPAKEITALNQRRDKIKKDGTEIANLKKQVEALDNQIQAETDPQKRETLEDKRDGLQAQIEDKSQKLSNFINPPQKSQKETKKTYAPVDDRVAEEISKLNRQILDTPDTEMPEAGKGDTSATSATKRREELLKRNAAVGQAQDDVLEKDKALQEARANGDEQAQVAAKSAFETAKENLAQKKEELDNFLSPPVKKETQPPPKPEYYEPTGEAKAEIDRLNDEINALRNDDERKNSTEISAKAKRRDAIQNQFDKIAKLEGQRDKKVAERTQAEADGKKQTANRLTGEIADKQTKIDAERKKFNELLHPRNEDEEPAENYPPVDDSVKDALETLDKQIENAKDGSAEKKNLEQKRRELENQNETVAKLRDERNQLEKDLSRKQVGSKGYRKVQNALDNKNRALANAEKKLAKLIEQPKPKEQKQEQSKPKKYEPVDTETKNAIANLKRDIKKLNEQISDAETDFLTGKTNGEKLKDLTNRRTEKKALLKDIQSQNDKCSELKDKAATALRIMNDTDKPQAERDKASDALSNYGAQLREELQKLHDLIPPEPVKAPKEKAPSKKAIKEKNTSNPQATPADESQSTLETPATDVQSESQPQESAPESKTVPEQSETNAQSEAQAEEASAQPTEPAQSKKKSAKAKAEPQKENQTQQEETVEPEQQTPPQLESKADEEEIIEPEQQKTQQDETAESESNADEEEYRTDDGSTFGSIEAAEREMIESLKELGIEPRKKENTPQTKEDTRRPKLVNFVEDDSDEALNREIAELQKELNKISSMPMFNPKIWKSALKIGAIYVQRGINNFADWAKKMTETVGTKIEPWNSAIWETINGLPEGTKFDEKQMLNVSRFIGALHEKGDVKSFDDVQAQFEQRFDKEAVEKILPMIRASYTGIEKYFADRMKSKAKPEPKTPLEKAAQKISDLIEQWNKKSLDEWKKKNPHRLNPPTKEVQELSDMVLAGVIAPDKAIDAADKLLNSTGKEQNKAREIYYDARDKMRAQAAQPSTSKPESEPNAEQKESRQDKGGIFDGQDEQNTTEELLGKIYREGRNLDNLGVDKTDKHREDIENFIQKTLSNLDKGSRILVEPQFGGQKLRAERANSFWLYRKTDYIGSPIPDVFEVHQGDFLVGEYNNEKDAIDAIIMLGEAIKRGDNEFKFPTTEELLAKNESEIIAKSKEPNTAEDEAEEPTSNEPLEEIKEVPESEIEQAEPITQDEQIDKNESEQNVVTRAVNYIEASSALRSLKKAVRSDKENLAKFRRHGKKSFSHKIADQHLIKARISQDGKTIRVTFSRPNADKIEYDVPVSELDKVIVDREQLSNLLFKNFSKAYSEQIKSKNLALSADKIKEIAKNLYNFPINGGNHELVVSNMYSEFRKYVPTSAEKAVLKEDYDAIKKYLDEQDNQSPNTTNVDKQSSTSKAETKFTSEDEQIELPANEIIYPEGALTYGDKSAADGFKSSEHMTLQAKKKFDEAMNRKVKINGQEMTRLEAVENMAKGTLDESAMKLDKKEREYLDWLKKNLIEPLKAIQQARLQEEKSPQKYSFSLTSEFDIGGWRNFGVELNSGVDERTMNNLKNLLLITGGRLAINEGKGIRFAFPNQERQVLFARAAQMFVNNEHLPYFSDNEKTLAEQKAKENLSPTEKARALLENISIPEGVKIAKVDIAPNKQGVWRVKLVGRFPDEKAHSKTHGNFFETARSFNGRLDNDGTFHFKNENDAKAFKQVLDEYFGLKGTARTFIENPDSLFNIEALRQKIPQGFLELVKSLGEKVKTQLQNGTLTQTTAEELASKLRDEFDAIGKQFDNGELTRQEAQEKLRTAVNDMKNSLDKNPQASTSKAETNDEGKQKLSAKQTDKHKEQTQAQEKAIENTVVLGNTAEVIAARNRPPHQIRYKVVEASDLNSSHTIDNGGVFANENYPAELQPRDRTRANMQAQLIGMGNNLNPADLLDARDVNLGAPVTRSDGVVLNGNGRTAAIRYAYENGKGDPYKNALIQNAEKFGLNADKISKMNQPVLVRELTHSLTDEEMRDLTGTQTGGARMGASEQAQADAAKLSQATLNQFPQGDNIDLAHAEATDFLLAALKDIAAPDEINSLTQSDGKISQDGINRVRRALFALAYGDSGLIARMSESTDDNVRGITNALLNAAPTIAKVQTAMKNGTLHNYDLSAITDAVKKLSALRDEGKPVSKYLQEQGLFAEYADSEEIKEILSFLDKNKRAPNKIAAFLKGIAQSIQNQGDPREDNLFGSNEPAPLIDLIKSARQKIENNGQQDLFAQSENPVQEKVSESKEQENKQSAKESKSKEKIDIAIDKLKAAHDFSDEQLKYVEGMREGLKLDNKTKITKKRFNVLNPNGFELANLAFQGKLEEIIDELNGYLSKETNGNAENFVASQKPSEKEATDQIEQRAREALKAAKLEGKISPENYTSRVFPGFGENDVYVEIDTRDKMPDSNFKRKITILAQQLDGSKATELLSGWTYGFSNRDEAQAFQKALDIYFGNEEASDNEESGTGERLDDGHRDVEPAVREGTDTEARTQGRTEISGEDTGQQRRNAKSVGTRNPESDAEGARPAEENDAGSASTRTGAGNGVRGDTRPVQPAAGAESGNARVSANADKVTKPYETSGHNFHIGENSGIGEGGLKEKFKQNVAAIKLLKQLEAENRKATPSEQAILAKFNGWGTLASAFSNDPKWTKENQQLRELLTPEEYDAAHGSITNAFYTSPAIAKTIWSGLERLGFKGGRILDPSMGSGIFFGTMPREFTGRSELTGVELDSLTGRIAQQLYQNADIEITGFQNRALPDNYFDLAISNIPFSSVRILEDPAYRKEGFQLHDYFFAKAINKVRPGGLVAFITSTGTLNSPKQLHKRLNQQADLIAAFKLPSNTFDKNADTQVTTDVVIFQKRFDARKPSEHAQDWYEVGKTLAQKEDTDITLFVPVNEYFDKHPEHMIGKPIIDTLWAGGNRLALDGKGLNVVKELGDLMSKLTENIYTPIQHAMPSTLDSTLAKISATQLDGTFTTQDGKVYQKQGDKLVEMKGKEAHTIKDYQSLLKNLDALLQAQLDPAATEENISELRKGLNQKYDAFVKNNGYLNSPKNIKLLSADPNYGRVAAIENYREDKKTKQVSASKADIFFKRTVGAIEEPVTAGTASDGLSLSLAMRGHVDMEYISDLTGKSESELERELGDLIYRNPMTNQHELAEEYLSGNVREKLAQAREATRKNPAFKRNVAALEKVQPLDLTEHDIAPHLGATWIKPEHYEAFVRHMLGNDLVGVEVMHDNITGQWFVNGNSRFGQNFHKWNVSGTKWDFMGLLEAAMNKITPTITKDKKIDETRTAEAREKIERLKDEFEKFVWTDAERKKDLLNTYNAKFNSETLRNYDGSHLTFPGLAQDIKEKLYPHQKDAIWRMMQGKNTLIAHCVGAGKTWEMFVAAMEMKRIGLIKKPLFVVPQNILKQFEREGRAAYPSAKFLTLTASDLAAPRINITFDETLDMNGRKKEAASAVKGNEKESANQRQARLFARRQALSKIATGDWDGIIISHDMFMRLPMSPETYNSFYRQQKELLEAQKKIQYGDKFGDKRHQKMLSNAISSLEQKLSRDINEEKKEIVIPFEELGIDQIFVDEADMFKNLGFSTHYNSGKGGKNVSGISKSNAQRSLDMYIKTKWLTKMRNGGGVVFATGTPISNTLNEIYTMQRYLDYPMLEENGIYHFDNWAGMFAKELDSMEASPSGNGFREVTRLKLTNLQTLIKQFQKIADIKLPEDLPHLTRPKLKNDTRTVVQINASEAFRGFKKELLARAKEIRDGHVDPTEDNFLKIISDFRKASLDMRLIDGSISESEAGAKIDAICDTVTAKYKETADVKGTQLIFSDLSVPKGKDINKEDVSDEQAAMEETISNDDISVYERIKKGLIKRGIPANQIAFVHEAKNPQQRQALFDRVNNGEIRVIIGSTGKMGAGTNFQKHLVALHHLDCPWRPRDIEQREGRILRSGNQNEEVEIFTYVTKGSYDANMWEKVSIKQSMIDSVLRGDPTIKELDDISEVSADYEDIASTAYENPLMSEEAKLSAKVRRLNYSKNLFLQQQRQRYAEQKKLSTQIPQTEQQIKNLKADIADKIDTRGDAFRMKIGNTEYTKRAEAGKAFAEMVETFNKATNTKVGEIGGFEIFMRTDFTQALRGGVLETVSKRVIVTLSNRGIYQAEPSLKSIEHFISQGLEKTLAITEKNLQRDKSALAAVNEDLARPFDKQAELDEAIKRWEEVKSQIAEGREKFSSKQAESEEESASEQNETPAEESELKEQPETQSEPEFAKLAESTNDAESAEDMTSSTKETLEFETGEFTHSKTGEKIPQAKLKDRVEREEYLRLNSLAKKHGGYYSKFSKSFLFKSAEERDAFVSEAVQNNNIGESESLTDAQINEAAKNPDTANALEQLGAKIENGKIITPEEETNDWLKRHVIIARAFDESKSSLRGSGDTTIRDYVALKDLTEQQKIYQRLGKDMGVRVVFFSNKNSDFHGAHAGNISYINVNGEMPINQVFWHESSHWLKSTNPELWEKLRKTAGITDAQRKAYLEDTERTDLTTNEAIDEEIISDYFEDAMKREGFFTEIGRKDPSLIQRVIAWLQDAMGKFFEYFNNPKGKLTNAQKQRMAHELGRVASKLVNQNGQKIFRYNNRTHAIELATGEKLENLDISNHTIDGIKKAVKGSKPEFEKLQKTNPINVSNHIPKQANNSNLKRATVDAFIDRYPQGVTVETKIGEVKISRSNIKESLGHTLYPSKADAVLSLPEGMRKAAYIGKLHDFYNKPIENHYFVYPIIYENKNRLVFCRIREITGRGHSFYVHDVFITDEIKVKSNALSQTQTPANRQGELRGVALYETILTEFFAEGNRKEPLEAGKYNAAEQFGGRFEDGRKIFDNSEDAAAYSQHVQNMERGEFKYSFAGERAKNAPPENKKAVVTVTGNEFGEYSDIKELRAKAKDFYKNFLRGTSVHNPILGEVNLTDDVVMFTNVGLNKMGATSAQYEKLLLVKYLPKLIETADRISSEENFKNKRNASQYSYLHSTANINGEVQDVNITIFTDVNGNRYYNHNLSKNPKTMEGLPVHLAQVPQTKDGIPTIDKPSNENIPQTKFAGNGDLERMFAEAKPVTNAQLNGQQRKWIELGKGLGVQVKWIDAHTNLKGALKDGVIYLNSRANDDVTKTFWHEQFHLTAALQPELYRDLLKYFSGKDAFSKEQLDAYREENNRTDLTDAEVIEEILSDNFGQVQKRVQLLRELGRDNSSLAERFVAWLKYLADKVAATFRNPEGGMTTAQRDAFIKGISDLADSMQAENAKAHTGLKFDNEQTIATDAEYLKAVDDYQNAKTDNQRQAALKKLQDMVQQAAEAAGFYNAVPEQTVAYKVRATAAPKKTIKVYKVFTVADDGSPTALFIGGTEKLPQNVWLDAQDAYHFKVKNGKYYVPSTQNPFTKGGKTGASVEIPDEMTRQELIDRGFLPKGSRATKITALAYRPGWHAGTLPFFPQGGTKRADSNYENIHRYNQVVFECEMAAEKNYTAEAEAQPKARTKSGKLNSREADLQYMPENGFYYYATNPLTHGHPELGNWVLSGSLKINRALTQEECDKILADNGKPPQEWEQGTLNLEELGYTGEQNDAARKTLAPITYDDNGEIIPLSQRFDVSKNDIRFSGSISGTSTTSTTEKLKAKIDNFLWNVKNERPRNHMRKLLEKLSGYQIRSGHVAEGIDILVKDISKVIRTPNAYEWKKLLPEVGKLVAKRLNLNPTTEQGNYIASWLMDGAPNDTSQAAKDFQRAMRETDDMYRDQLLEVQSIFSEWANRPPEQIAKDVIAHGNETKPLIDRGKGKLDEGYQQFVEELYPVKQLVDQYEKDNAKKLAAGENPYIFLRLLRGLAGRGKIMIEGDERTVGVLKRLFPSVDFNNFKTLNTILQSCNALDNEENQREFSAYLLACAVKDLHKLNAANLRQQAELRDKIDTLEDELDTLTDKKKIKDTEKRIEKLQDELKALKKKIYATPFDEYETTYDNKVCDGTIAKYKDKYGQAQKDIINYQRTLLDMMVDSGFLSEEQKIGYMKNYPNHIPMFRKFDENEDKNFGDSLKAMTGSTRDIIDPIASLTKNTYDFVRRAEKNKAKCLLANLARTGALGTVVEVDERTPLDEVDNKKPDVNTTITFFEGGQKKYLDTDPAVVKAVNNLSIPQMSWAMKFLRVGTILLRNFATVFNPPFAFRNLIMDNQNAMLYSKYGFFSPADFVRGFLGVWNRDADYNEWMALGGAQASFWSVDRDYTQASLDRLRKGRWGQYKSFTGAFKLLSLLGEYSELATRVGYYKKAKKALAAKNGGKIDTNILIEAALESRDLTDFARGGKSSRSWNNAVAFANASIQGWDKFFRTYDPRQYWSKDPEVKKQWERAMIRLALGSIAPTVLCFLINTSGDDDDWYEKDLPDWERQTHWILGENIRIPKGQDVGLRFFSNLTESMLRYMAKNDPKAFQEWWKPVVNSLPDICPTALQPIFECAANYDWFRKNAIVPARQQRLPEYMQYDNRTSALAKGIGDSSLAKFIFGETGISPAKVDHFIYGYTGKLGQDVLRFVENVTGARDFDYSGLTDLPIISGIKSGFLRVPYRNPRILTEYYETLDEQTKLHNEFKLTKKRPEGYNHSLYTKLQKAQEQMRELTKKERKVLDDTNLDGDERDNRQLAIQKKRVALAERVLR